MKTTNRTGQNYYGRTETSRYLFRSFEPYPGDKHLLPFDLRCRARYRHERNPYPRLCKHATTATFDRFHIINEIFHLSLKANYNSHTKHSSTETPVVEVLLVQSKIIVYQI